MSQKYWPHPPPYLRDVIYEWSLSIPWKLENVGGNDNFTFLVEGQVRDKKIDITRSKICKSYESQAFFQTHMILHHTLNPQYTTFSPTQKSAVSVSFSVVI